MKYLTTVGSKWSRGRVARQWSAKPSTAVRIRSRPLNPPEFQEGFLFQIRKPCPLGKVMFLWLCLFLDLGFENY